MKKKERKISKHEGKRVLHVRAGIVGTVDGTYDIMDDLEIHVKWDDDKGVDGWEDVWDESDVGTTKKHPLRLVADDYAPNYGSKRKRLVAMLDLIDNNVGEVTYKWKKQLPTRESFGHDTIFITKTTNKRFMASLYLFGREGVLHSGLRIDPAATLQSLRSIIVAELNSQVEDADVMSIGRPSAGRERS